MSFSPIGHELETVARATVDSAIAVHRELGPGLLESVYEHCLAHELVSRGLHVGRQVPQPVTYAGERLDAGFRLDLLVENSVIVEVKAVDALASIHEAQLLTYLRLSRCRLGLLINFNSILLKNGIRRLVL